MRDKYIRRVNVERLVSIAHGARSIALSVIHTPVHLSYHVKNSTETL
jgi:hypothetical protein